MNCILRHQIVDEGHFFFIEEFQLISTKGVIELECDHFVTPNENGCRPHRKKKPECDQVSKSNYKFVRNMRGGGEGDEDKHVK